MKKMKLKFLRKWRKNYQIRKEMKTNMSHSSLASAVYAADAINIDMNNKKNLHLNFL